MNLSKESNNISKLIFKAALIVAAFLLVQNIFAQQTLSPNTDYLTDFGKMWTFDDLPLDYFQDEYGFTPSDEWIEHLQKSALQFGGGCSGAFISADGLIMTNHHCGRGGLVKIQKEGEDLLRDGFYAKTLDEERKVDGFYVDQLMLIKDVSDDIISAMKEGKTDAEKVEKRNAKIKELQEQYKNDTGLICKVVSLYNGGKYSMYCYKRYDDIRAVMAPEFQMASTGWDWDNFTYPRFELDFSFFRAYENGKPAKIKNYFTWNENGAEPGDPIFIIGRPGNTDRQVSSAELEYMRDVYLPYLVTTLDAIYYAYFDMYKTHPERESELLNNVMSFGNARKSLRGRLDGLLNAELMKRKKAFEKKLIEKVKNNPELNSAYGNIWKALAQAISEKSKIQQKYMLYQPMRWGRSQYLDIAFKVIETAKQLSKPESDREAQYQGNKIDETIANIFPDNFDEELNRKLLRVFVEDAYLALGKDDKTVKKLFNEKRGDEAVEYLLNNSQITSRRSIQQLFEDKNPDEILSSSDPIISFLISNEKDAEKYRERLKEINNTIEVLNQELGEVTFKVYGDRMPPDATLTLRLSDGTMKGYEYNGTIAPPKTTYYGMYDRYYSFGQKKYPWGLSPKWKTPPADFDLSTPLDFAATLDIVGGNSGSSIVNKDGEIIGLVFDGNMESLAGDYLYMPEDNRAVAVDAKGLTEALRKVYKTDRLLHEILNGMMEPN